ncbi:MAG: polymer-forming cytoskeletal protein [Rhodospirillales bacterium]
MFSSSKSSTIQSKTKEPSASDKPAAPSILSSDLHVIGNLNSDGEIQVDGIVDGDIFTKSLMIGEAAVIKGEVNADSVIVHGTINGQIKARSVSLMKSAHVVGDILHEDLAIEKGAFLEGHCRRISIDQDKKETGKAKINLFKDKSSSDKDKAEIPSVTSQPGAAGSPV